MVNIKEEDIQELIKNINNMIENLNQQIEKAKTQSFYSIYCAKKSILEEVILLINHHLISVPLMREQINKANNGKQNHETTSK